MGILVTDREIGLFHSVAREIQRLAGVEIEYYHFSVNDMKTLNGGIGYDPLYGEKTCDSTWGMTGRDGISTESLGHPYIIMGIYDSDEPNYNAAERGTVKDSDTLLYLSRMDFDLLGIGKPEIGDIVRYRSIYWNVNKVVNDGWLDMSHENYSLYKLTLAYNTKLSLATKIDDSRIGAIPYVRGSVYDFAGISENVVGKVSAVKGSVSDGVTGSDNAGKDLFLRSSVLDNVAGSENVSGVISALRGNIFDGIGIS
jgi:hypothetical protein